MKFQQGNGNKIENISLHPGANGVMSLNGPGGPLQPTVPEASSASLGGVSLSNYPDLYKLGEDWAIGKGVLEIKPEDLQPLIERARAMARDAYRELFDPSKLGADQLRDEEFKKLLGDRKEAEVVERHAAADLAEWEETLAKLFPGSPPKPPSLGWKAAGVVVIALTVAVTLHDQVFLFADEITSWAISLLGGIVCGWFVVSCILYNPEVNIEATATRGNWNRFGLIAGIGIGIAFFGLRISQPDDVSSVVFALAMTALEIATIVALHSVAGRYHDALRVWQEKEQPASKTASSRDVAKGRFETCRQRRVELDEAVKQHIGYVESRELRNKMAKEIEDLAEKDVTNGAYHGLAINIGRVRGVKKGDIK